MSQLIVRTDGTVLEGLVLTDSQRLGITASLRIEADNVTVRSCSGGAFVLYGATNVIMENCDWGPATDTVCRLKSVCRDVRIVGCRFHGFHKQNPEQHMEAVHVEGCDGLEIRNSLFWDNDNFHIFLKQFPDGNPINNTHIGGNWFGPMGEKEYALRYSGPMGLDHTIRRNVFMAPYTLPAGAINESNVRL